MHNRPVFSSATGQAVIPVPFLPEGSVRNALAKGRFRDPPGSQPSSPPPFESQRRTSGGPAFASEVAPAEPGPRKQPFACVPHADGFVGLLRCPRDRSLAPTSPRSCELSPGHSLEPSAPDAVVCPVRFRKDPRSADPDLIHALRSPASLADLRAPFHAVKTIAARSVSVRDGHDDI